MARESFFDDLARGLADGSVTRAKALRLMGAALVGGTLTSFGIGGVAAADVRCSEEQRRCGVRCVNLKTNERHCGSCFNRCRSTQTCCKGRCVNLQRNERHCGSCFNRCEEGQECVGGVCQGGCPTGTTLCGGVCVSNVCRTSEFFNIKTCKCQCVGLTIRCGGNCVSKCPSGQTLNCSTCQCESGICPDHFNGTTLCGGNCVVNCFNAHQSLNCSTCRCESSVCSSGYTEIDFPDFGTFCCPNAQVCGFGGSAQCCASTETCVNGLCQTA